MKNNELIWVIDDDRSIRWVLERALSAANIAVTTFDSATTIIEKLKQIQPTVIVSDIRMPGIDGLQLLANINELYPEIPVIIITAHADLDNAVSAYQGGVFEYLPKPFDVDEAVFLVKRAMTHRINSQRINHPSTSPNVPVIDLSADIIGEAPAMQEVFRAIGRLSRSNMTVLINGESGTGKELVAYALHQHSPRVNQPFIAINTAAIPKDLLESELFGHERGAFTGAQTTRRGRFEQADQGTFFLDEIGDMPVELQTRLLRVLSSGEFYRVGGLEPITADVRIIAATHQDLEQRVKEGSFREDLYHRLNVVRVHIPALRDRREDIPALLNSFLVRAAQELKVDVKSLSSETQTYLCQLDWPGNVRQLENTCRWLTVMASGHVIQLEDLPPELKILPRLPTTTEHDHWEYALEDWIRQCIQRGETGILQSTTQTFERLVIQIALQHTNGHRQDTAKLLGLGRNTLTRKIKELDIRVANITAEK